MNRIQLVAMLALIPGALLSEEPERVVSIRIYDKSGLSRGDTARGLTELKAIFRSAGIQAAVRECSSPDSCAEDFGVNEVGVRLLAGRSPSEPRQLAAAFVARGGNLSTVFAGAVIDVAARAGVATGPVLGCAMAHEVAHLLGLPHSRTGVMGAGWTDADYRAMSDGRMLFTRTERAAIHSRIAGNLSSASLTESAADSSRSRTK